MQILNWLPPHARQIRYIHPYYDHQEDEDGNVVDEWLANESTCTDVWKDVVEVVKKYKKPIYFRRRTQAIAKDMVTDYSCTDNGTKFKPKMNGIQIIGSVTPFVSSDWAEESVYFFMMRSILLCDVSNKEKKFSSHQKKSTQPQAKGTVQGTAN